MRAFLAMNLPEEALNNLEKMGSGLLSFCRRGTPVPRSNMHMTLRFLGDISSRQADSIAAALDSFSFFESALGSFCSLKALTSSVICAELKPRPSVCNIEKAISDILSRLGFERHNGRYLPHVTLIRNYALELPFSEIIKNIPVYNKPFSLDSITLYESILTPKGAVYRDIGSVNLQKQGKI